MESRRAASKNGGFLAEALAFNLERSRNRTLVLLEQVPDGLLGWAPSSGRLSIGGIFFHIFEIDSRWYTALEGVSSPLPPTYSKEPSEEELKTLLVWSGNWRESFARANNGSRLLEAYDAPGGGTSSGFDAMQYLMRHESYNQAFLVSYLRAMGVEGRAIQCLCHELGVDLRR
jgi:uncharacterized damage-inducible protein DinB